LIEKFEDVSKEVEDWVADEERVKTLDRAQVDAMMDVWLVDFNLVHPSQFFKEHPTNDSELVCSIQTEKQFMMTTLEFFGLPKKYMDGNGHFPTWGKEKKDDKAAARKKALAKKTGAKKGGSKLDALKKKRGLDK
jgi:hypothetical protein